MFSPQSPAHIGLVVHTDNSTTATHFRSELERTRYIEQMQGLSHVRAIEHCMLFETAGLKTGHAAFDAQTNFFGTGNVIANTMFGNYVRPRHELECNGTTFTQNELQTSDLQWFAHNRELSRVSEYVQSEVRFETQTCIAYALFHKPKRGQRVFHGALLTEPAGALIKSFTRKELGMSASSKSDAVLAAAVFYLSDHRITERQLIWSRQ